MLGAFRGARSLSRSAIRIASSTSSCSRPCVPVRPYLSSPRCPLQTSIKTFHSSSLRLQEAAPQPEEIPEDVVELSRFQELADHGLVSPNVINTITQRMNIETMTDVQRLTINETLDGTDVIAQAKTGTGKTIAFLMPIVQRILKDKALERRSYGKRSIDIRGLIISPTRELAEQIAVEAKKVVSATDIRVQTAVGGTGKQQALQRMRREGCHLLVGTPGRVKDLLSDPYSGVKVDNLEMFVLDEADRLLDIGFAPEIAEIQSYMPQSIERPRQTLMFSATVPREVVGLVRKTLRPDFKFIRTSDPNEQPTHERIEQKVVFVRGLENRLPAIFELAHRAIKAHETDPANNPSFKAIVYFGSTSDVALAREIFGNMRGPMDGSSTSNFTHPLAPAEIVEMHSKLSQGERTRNSAQFRRAKSAILFSSDVTARGMDFPDVSHVIQVGLPRNDDDYIHRLGRTGRAGKNGEGWLVVLEQQMREFRRGLGAELPIKPDNTLQTATVDMTQPGQISPEGAAIMKKVNEGVKATPYMSKAQAYASMFGVLSGSYRDKQALVDDLNNLAKFGWGLQTLPPVSPSMISRIGLGRVEGLNVQEDFGRSSRGDKGGRRDSFGSGFNSDDPFAEQPTQNRGGRGDRPGRGFDGGRGSDRGGNRGGDRGFSGRGRY